MKDFDKDKIIVLQKKKIEEMSKIISAQEQEISLLKHQLSQKINGQKVSAL